MLRLALVVWPRRLTRAQIARRLRAGEPELAAAIRRLLAVGLLVRDGAHLVPSAAALRFDRLPID